MSRDPLELAAILLAPLLGGDLVEFFADERRVEELRAHAEPYVDPDAEVVFHAADAVVLDVGPGVGGVVAGWREWLSTFASYRVTIEDLRHEGDRVIVLVRQSGRTIHGGVEVPSSPSAAIFSIRDGRLVRLAFYLDRGDAAALEGFELP